MPIFRSYNVTGGRYRILSSLIASMLLITSLGVLQTKAASIYVDANIGNDTNGNGSENQPYQTLALALAAATGGDTIVLNDGNYGSLRYSNSGDIFDAWVEIKAADGANPQLNDVKFLGDGGDNHSGSFNAYIRLSGIHILGVSVDYAIELRGPRHLEISNCLIEIEGPWSGSEAALEKTGVYLRGGADITIRDCELTRVGCGFQLRAHNVRILNNHIHDITHDGIRSMGLWNSLIEGNRIHGLDDGVEDTDASWSKHCDGIHIFIMGGSAENLQPNQNVTYRGNILYDIESQGIQFNNYGPVPEIHNNNLIFENNIFGPVGAYNIVNNSDPVDTLTFRNNSVVYIPGGTYYTSPYTESGRTIHSFRHGVAFTQSTTGLQVYNNIMVHQWGWPTDGAEIFDYNVVYNVNSGAALGGPHTIGVSTEQYANPTAFDGALLPASPAIDAGTTPVHGVDAFLGIRDSQPDIGAREASAQTNQAPTLEWIADQRMFEDRILTIEVSAHDPDTETLTLAATQLPAFADFIDQGNGSGTLTLSPGAGDAGVYDQMTITASDGIVSDSRTFRLEVVAVERSDSVLLAHWEFEDSTADSTGGTADGILLDSASFSDDGIFMTKALEVNGGRMQVTHSSSIDISSDFTLAAYIDPAPQATQNIMSKGFNDGYRFRVMNTNQIQLIAGIPDSGPNQVVTPRSTGVVSSGSWQHVAVTVDFEGTTGAVKFYINHQLDSTQTIDMAAIETNQGDLIIGAATSNGSESFIGRIDDVRIYDGALTESEIALLGLAPEETWGGFPVVNSQVNTGNWIGWLYLISNTNWVYSYSLQKFIYLPEPVFASGAWTYFPKL